MAYNFCVKEFANGTVQLTYYDYPILDKFDKESAKFKKGFYDVVPVNYEKFSHKKTAIIFELIPVTQKIIAVVFHFSMKNIGHHIHG